MSEVLWQAIIAGIVTVVLGYMQMKTRQALGEITQTTKDTHTLVNNNMAIQLRLNLALAKRLYESTGRPEDKEAVELAGVLYSEHMEKQRKVDEAIEHRKEKS